MMVNIELCFPKGVAIVDVRNIVVYIMADHGIIRVNPQSRSTTTTSRKEGFKSIKEKVYQSRVERAG